MRRILGGVAVWLLSFLANQLAARYDIQYGLLAGAAASCIGYGLIVTSEPVKRVWRRSARTRRTTFAMIVSVGVITGIIGSVVAWILMRQVAAETTSAPPSTLPQKSGERPLVIAPKIIAAAPAAPALQHPKRASPQLIVLDSSVLWRKVDDRRQFSIDISLKNESDTPAANVLVSVAMFWGGTALVTDNAPRRHASFGPRQIFTLNLNPSLDESEAVLLAERKKELVIDMDVSYPTNGKMSTLKYEASVVPIAGDRFMLDVIKHEWTMQ